jgi:hypothetical protein
LQKRPLEARKASGTALALSKGDPRCGGLSMKDMKRIVALVVIAAGVLILVYGGFTFTKETHTADLPIVGEVSVKEKERVNIPIWAGIATIAVGCGLLLVPSARKGA